MPGFLFAVRVRSVLVADHIRTARRMHADDVALVRRELTDAAVAGERGEALVERIEAAVFRAALVERTEARGGRVGISLSRELPAGNDRKPESSGEGKKAHDEISCLIR